MINIQDFIANIGMFKKFSVDELLFVEFKCPIEDPRTVLWCNNNFFGFILNGQTMLKTPRNEYRLNSGDCFFVKKGGILIESDYQEDFCELLVFVPDEFIRAVVQKHTVSPSLSTAPNTDSVIYFGPDEVLQAYFNSLFSYFNEQSAPSQALLKLKFEELVVRMLSSDKYQVIENYFGEVCRSSKPSIRNIMDDNFCYNLSIAEFARLCARSVSTFKTEFKNLYHTTPARWLQEKRLEFSKYLIDTTDDTLDEICFRCGFENESHFVRVFKNKYGITPGRSRINRLGSMHHTL